MKARESQEQILARVFSEQSRSKSPNEPAPPHDPTLEYPLDWLPPQVEARLAPLSIDELRARILAHGEIEAVLAADQGAMLIVIKKKVGHDNWKTWLETSEIDYEWANRRMRICRGLVRHPSLRHIRSIDILDRVLSLPYLKQEAIAVEFSHTDGEGNTKTYKELRPWIVEEIGAQSTRKRMEEAPVHRFQAPPPPPTEEENFKREWDRRLGQENWNLLCHYLQEIGHLAKRAVKLCEEMGMEPYRESIPERFYDQIREKKLVQLYAPHVAKITNRIHPTDEALERIAARKKTEQCDDDSLKKN